MTSTAADSLRQRPGDAISGLLAMASIVFSAIACGLGLLLQLEARPARMTLVSGVLLLVAARMSDRYRRLVLFALGAAMVGFVAGMTIAVITENAII
ncbi:MAG: hypothetical protein ACKVUT_00255 [Gaiella sp.]